MKQINNAMPTRGMIRTINFFLLLMLITGCASNPGSNNVWGYAGTAAVESFKDKSTWVPLIAAGLFAIKDYDEQVTEWAAEENLLFGSQKRADNRSHTLSTLSHVTLVVAALPSLDSLKTKSFKENISGTWERSKQSALAHVVNFGFTQGFKENIDRERPGVENPGSRTPGKIGSESFPSGHTSYAVVSAIEASKLIDRMDITRKAKRYARFANYTVAGLSAWARLEANRHYPSDVLTSFALGSFASGFANRLIKTKLDSQNQVLRIDTNGNSGLILSYSYAW